MHIRLFSELSRGDAALAGGKGASLGEMVNAGVPVPPGFVVLADAFEKFLDETDLNIEIDTILHTVNTEEMRSVEHASEKIQKLILESKMSADIADEILADFKKLNARFVAVRSSATAEDSDSAAWAGQLDTFLNTTDETLLQNVQRCWASLFTPRAVFYRFEKDLHETKISVAVVVQRMIQSEISGIAFSVHPVTEDRNQLIIEAGYGLGEAIVSGQITPDSYVVEKSPRRIIDTNIADQERGIFRKTNGGEEPNEWRFVLAEKRNLQKLSNDQILELSEIIIGIEKHYGFPCDIEWAFCENKFYIVQCRPITTLTPGGGSDSLSHQDELSVPSLGEGVVLSKIYTRERPLFYFYVFPDGEKFGIRKYFDQDIDDILVIFPSGNGSGEVWYPKQSLEEIESVGMKKIAGDPALARQVIVDAEMAWEKLAPYLVDNQSIRNIEEANQYYRYLVDFWSALNTIFFLLVDNGKLPQEFSQGLLGVRDKTQHYTAKMSTVFLDFIDREYPDFSAVSSYIAPGEISELSKADTAAVLLIRLRKRSSEGCFVFRNTLYDLSRLGDILLENNLVFEREATADSQIPGQIGYQGKVTGPVRNIRSRSDLVDVLSGDILVAPITDAHYIQAMERAAAFVTDEGGIMSHAAIIAREMKKPCIIGTKIATKVFHDGDLVEVDADNGVVRILEKGSSAGVSGKERELRYKKAYTRENCLLAFQVWEEHQTKTLAKILDWADRPILFDVYEGVARVYYHERTFIDCDASIAKKSSDDPDFVRKTMIWYGSILDYFEPIWKSGQPLKSRAELLEFYERALDAWCGLDVSYVVPLMDTAGDDDKQLALHMRERAADFLEEIDHVFQRTLHVLYPEFGALIKYLRIEEVRDGVLPTVSMLEEREKHFIYYDRKLVTDMNIDGFLAEGGIEIIEEQARHVFNVNGLEGQAAMGGVACGRVRVLRKKSEIPYLQDGEVLVTAMTTPDYLPAMKKSVAFVTDEGGITCHAAIVSRELGKPCIIGTKIATQVLHDGDLVEVDADNGVVRIIGRV